MDIEYKTVEKESFDEFTEKKSRFIGYVCPVKTQAEATEFISKIKSKHWDATHNVSAYVLRENNIQRSSDDGEPSGTAGVPILDVLLKEKLVDVCVVVTRYFGGILLGAGGLIRAYSHGSKIAVESGNIITMSLCKVFTVSVDYSFYERLNILLSSVKANIENTEFADNVKVTFSIKAELKDFLQSRLTEQSNGKYLINEIGEKFAKTE
ncbi:MAG: YigZ family protein [Eubacteriales bacterium]|nr:YigZ family protein [Eubacteriales bacterium]